MLISQVLRRKGNDVATTPPDGTIADVLSELAEHGVGALVVSTNGTSVEGIISERDIVRALAATGPLVLEMSTRELMTENVVTCSPEATTEQLMEHMTQRRFRHVPVTENGELVGIVSIGDVVNARVDELETERQQLTDYISGR